MTSEDRWWDRTIISDLDGTICHSDVERQYENARPDEYVIRELNSLKEKGWRVVVFTARGMITYKGDIEKIEASWRSIIEQQLSIWGLNYDELIFGKPPGRWYLDDRALLIENKDTLFRSGRDSSIETLDDLIWSLG